MRQPRRGVSSSLASSRTRWSLATFFSLLVLLLTWAFATPRYGAPDELSHTIKAYGTAHGQLLGSTTPGQSTLIRMYEVPKGLASGEPWCFASLPEANAGCSVAIRDDTTVAAESSAATYPVPFYAVVGSAARLFGESDYAPAYRLISLLISCAILTFALVLFRAGFGARSAIALLALNPMTVFILASMNPAVIELAGMLVLWAFFGYLLTRETPAGRNDLLIASSIGAALVLVRPVSLPWVAIAFAGYFLLEWRSLSVLRREGWRGVAIAAVPLGVAIVVSSIWSRVAGVGLTDDKFVIDAPTIDIARVALGRTALLLRQGFGNLGWLDTQLPSGIFGLWLALLVCVASAVLFFGDRRTKLLMLGLAVVWIAYPAVYATLARTPAVWQGRYNLPLLGGLVVCALIAVTSDQPGAPARQLARLCAGAFVVIDVVAMHQSLRRFMVGASGDILLRNPGWRPRFDPWFLLVVNLVSATALALTMLSSRDTESVPAAASVGPDS